MKKLITILGMCALCLQSGLLTSYAQEKPKEDYDAVLEAKVDQIMDKYIEKEIPGASIGIVKDGKLVLTKGYGVSNIETKTPVTPDKTIFSIGSVTKLFTWSTLMKLAEEGKVDLTADIQTYLPDGTLDLAFDKKITILDLMHHTAGFEEKIEGMNLESVDQLKPLKETITKEKQPKQVYEPGTVTAYSNYGTNLAGYIIEQVTGEEYQDYMNRTIVKKLEMNHSTFSVLIDDQPDIKDNMSLGYLFDGTTFREGEPFLSNDVPAGVAKSTAEDMTHFLLMLLDDEGKSPYKFFDQAKMVKKYKTQSYHMTQGALGNAHGFWEKEVNGKRVIDHPGNEEGFSAILSLAPEEGSGYVLLTSLNNEATGVRDELEALLYGEDTSTDKLPLKQSTNDQKAVGRYRFARRIHSTMGKVSDYVVNTDTTITENKEGGILVKNSGAKEGILYVETEPGIYRKVDKQKDKNSDPYLYFEFNESGKALRMGTGYTVDKLPVTSFLETQAFNLSAFAVSFIAYLGSLIYLLIKFIKQKRQKKERGWSRNDSLLAVFAAVGLLVLLTATVMILKFAANLAIVFSSMQVLFCINWLLPVFVIAMCIWLAVTWRKNEMKWLTLFLIMVGLLTTVQFYNAHLFF